MINFEFWSQSQENMSRSYVNPKNQRKNMMNYILYEEKEAYLGLF